MANEKSNADAVKKDSGEGFLAVQDMTCKPPDGIRVHDIPVFNEKGDMVDVKAVKCVYDKRTKVPKNIGLQFLKYKTFVVSIVSDDPAKDGKVLKPLDIHEGGDGGLKLADNEIVANYDELSSEALFRRCHILPKSEGIDEDSTREGMIAFLKKSRAELAAKSVTATAGDVKAKMQGGELSGQLSEGEITSLVSDSPLLSRAA